MNFLVPPDKITKYLLTNPKKSGFFLPVGYSPDHWTQLRDDLIKVAASNAAKVRQTTAYGTEIEISGAIAAPNGRRIMIRTGWIILNGDPTSARFLTAYPF